MRTSAPAAENRTTREIFNDLEPEVREQAYDCIWADLDPDQREQVFQMALGEVHDHDARVRLWSKVNEYREDAIEAAQ